MIRIDVPALSTPAVALVTGGGSGIGKATAARLAASGSAVVVGYNSRKELAEDVVKRAAGYRASRSAHRDRRSILYRRSRGAGGEGVRPARCTRSIVEAPRRQCPPTILTH